METAAVAEAFKPDVAREEKTAERLLAYGAPAYRLAARVLGSHEGAEDAVQQAYLEALGRLRAAPPPRDARTWFLKVVVLVARHRRRSEANRRRREAAVRPERAGAPPGGDPELVPRLRAELAALEEKHRLAVSLCCEEGLSRREAAAVLAVPERTVSEHVRVGLERLRQSLVRAGYAAVPAAVLGALKATAPAVPASLAPSVESLVASSLASGAKGVITRAAAVKVAAKGGFTMKLVAGVVLAGALATGAAVTFSKREGPAPLPAGKRPGGKQEAPPAGEIVYQRVTLAGTAVAGYQDGPSTGSMIISWNGDADDAGNVTWMERGWYAVLRRYDAEAKLVRTYGGSANGHLDGPIATARFSSGSYMDCDDVRVSADGKWMYVGDPGYGDGVLRIVDVEKGTVSTVPGLKAIQSFTVDGKGTCYVSTYGGIYRVTPDGKVEKLAHLKKREGGKAIQGGGYFARSLEVDEANNILYAMVREKKNRFWRWDLKTGEATVLFDPVNTNVPGARRKGVSGPAKGASVMCPSGISINPAEAGKVFYWGGGDDVTFYRHNIEREWFDGFKPIGGDRFVFGDSKPMRQGAVGTWAFAPRWDSHGNMYFAWGIWPKLLTFRPVK